MSGIYIKGLEMPTNCCQCPVNMEVCKRGYKYLLEHAELYDKRADDCPLVPVPDHGRLIDVDALLESEPAYTIPNYNSDGYLADAEGAYTEVQIENAPTIIPAEEGLK